MTKQGTCVVPSLVWRFVDNRRSAVDYAVKSWRALAARVSERFPVDTLICFKSMRTFVNGTIALLLIGPLMATSAVAETLPFAIDSYTLDYPVSWVHTVQRAPDGSQLQVFTGPQRSGAIPFCHTTEQPLQPSLAPRASKMTDKQRVEFFSTADQSLLFAVFSNLATAPGFRLLYAGPSVVGKHVPGFTADFIYRLPQGFSYRVRAHYTFWKTAQLSIWCQTVAKSDVLADKSFHANLAEFQRFIASLKLESSAK